MKYHPLIPLLIQPILLATMGHSQRLWHLPGCRADYAVVVRDDARAAANLIPRRPQPNLNLTAAENLARLRFTSPDITYPALFHHNLALIDVQETGDDARHLTSEERTLFLWPEARAAAKRVIERCVVSTEGEKGGREEFAVEADGRRKTFEVRVRGKSLRKINWVLGHWRDRGFMLVPPVHGPVVIVGGGDEESGNEGSRDEGSRDKEGDGLIAASWR